MFTYETSYSTYSKVQDLMKSKEGVCEVIPKVTQVGNCTFLDTGGVFKKFDNGYDLSIVNLSDYV